MTQPKPHKHAALIRQWADLIANGEVEAGWWQWRIFIEGSPRGSWTEPRAIENPPKFLENSCYEIIMTDKHPDNAKPVLDWSKVPVGAMTTHGPFVGVNLFGCPQTLLNGPPTLFACRAEKLELRLMTMWFDGQPTQEQRAMFDVEERDSQVRDKSWSKTFSDQVGKIWRIKGARK